MKNNFIKLSLVAALAVSIFGCASSGPELSEVSPVSLPRAPIAPSIDEMSQAPKIVVMTPRSGQGVDSRFATLAQQELQSLMTSAGNDVIDRTLTTQARKELEFAEMNGVYRTTGPKVADIALMGEISRVSWNAEYKPRETWTDKDGEWHEEPAFCGYVGTVKLTIRAFALPDMIPLGNYDLDGSSRNKVVGASRSCPASEGNLDGLMTSTVRGAINDNSDQILDDLARPFYVTERRQVGPQAKEALFLINAGLGAGAQRGLTVRFFRVNKYTNDFTGEMRIEEIQVAEGKLTDNISQDGSFVLVKGGDMDKIMAGDIARFVRNTCPRGKERILGMCL